jgi:hypothetical protein
MYIHIKNTEQILALVSIKLVNEIEKYSKLFCRHEQFGNIVNRKYHKVRQGQVS